MLHFIRKMILRIKLALSAFLRALPVWFRTRYFSALLLVPIVFSIFVYQAADENVLGWKEPATCMDMMSIAHAALLIVSILLAAAGFAWSRNPSRVFLGVMCASAGIPTLRRSGRGMLYPPDVDFSIPTQTAPYYIKGHGVGHKSPIEASASSGISLIEDISSRILRAGYIVSIKNRHQVEFFFKGCI